MEKERSKLGFIALLALPFLLFAAAVAAVVMRHGQEMAESMSLTLGQVFSDDIYLILGAFAISFAAELGLLFIAIRSYARKATSLENLSQEQEYGARLLVRRDLELTRANEQLHKLDEVKSSFVSVVAHQLRTPLSGIKWTLNLLLKGDLGTLSKEQQAFLSKAYESNDRMIALVNDMLGADRIESGKIRYRFAPLSLLPVIDAALFELSSAARAKEVALQFRNRPEKIPLVRADAEQIHAVLQNLLENAIKYSRAGGTVLLGLDVGNGEVTVTVKDDGIGIPREQQK
ncbi:MAG: HAMP domain-containing histidine kinase, partial [Parcubacteria group bacterium]|nr:HAMP domain-containing histidine kinase [Parcubacteria group bacterium]